MSTIKRVDRSRLAELGDFTAHELANATWITQATDGTTRAHFHWTAPRDRVRLHGDTALRVESDRRPTWMRAHG